MSSSSDQTRKSCGDAAQHLVLPTTAGEASWRFRIDDGLDAPRCDTMYTFYGARAHQLLFAPERSGAAFHSFRSAQLPRVVDRKHI